MLSAKKDLQRRQRRWADAAGVRSDASGYVPHLEDNLRVALSMGARSAFVGGPELQPRRRRPPKLLALHSSAALVANVFDHFSERDRAPLAAAFGLQGRIVRLCFEAQFPTGLPGQPPAVDVALVLDFGEQVAVESKFSEWLVRRPRHKAIFKPKYFPAGRGVWAEYGLPRCQALAEELQARTERFKHLHAAQLLKHALGLAAWAAGEARSTPTRSSPSFALCYLYYDWPGRESAVHRAELERFTARVAGELRFSGLTYQALYRRLRDTSGIDRAYVDYLKARYFADVR
jgi:Restriction Endonuclease associating with ARP